MRREQSVTRNELAAQAWDAVFGLEKFNPLADWSENDVWSYLREHELDNGYARPIEGVIAFFDQGAGEVLEHDGGGVPLR